MSEPIQNNNSNIFTYGFDYKRNAILLADFGTGSFKVSLKRPNSDTEEIFTKKIQNTSKVKTTLEYKTLEAIDLLRTYSTEDSPEVNQKELWEIYDNLYKLNETELKNTQEKNMNNTYEETTPSGKVLDNFERAARHYSDPNSPDGENINVDELYDMAEMLLGWGGYTKEEKEEKEEK